MTEEQSARGSSVLAWHQHRALCQAPRTGYPCTREGLRREPSNLSRGTQQGAGSRRSPTDLSQRDKGIVGVAWGGGTEHSLQGQAPKAAAWSQLLDDPHQPFKPPGPQCPAPLGQNLGITKERIFQGTKSRAGDWDPTDGHLGVRLESKAACTRLEKEWVQSAAPQDYGLRGSLNHTEAKLGGLGAKRVAGQKHCQI